MSKQLVLILLTSIGMVILAIMLTAKPTNAQGPDAGGATPVPSTTPALELTGAGWVEVGLLEPAGDISVQAVNPVDCAVLNAPVVGLEISRGQTPADVADFINDLTLNGFSVGTVNLNAGPIPACVEVLVVVGLAQNMALSSAYTAADGVLLQTWAAAGHGLMLLGDWGPFRPETEALFQTYGQPQGWLPATLKSTL